MRKILDNKKGISTMIEYVLLIVIVISMSGIVYLWMKTYVPKENIKCEEGVSLYITEVSCFSVANGYKLDVTLKNSGRFNIRGFFIHATENPTDELATVDLSEKQINKDMMPNEVLFASPEYNSLVPTDKRSFNFSLDKPIYSIEIIPTKLETVNGKNILALCGEGKIKEQISCN